MRHFMSLALMVSILGGGSLLIGCDHEISDKEKVKVKDDGTVVKDREQVKQRSDGTVVKEEQHSVEH